MQRSTRSGLGLELVKLFKYGIHINADNHYRIRYVLFDIWGNDITLNQNNRDYYTVLLT